MAHHQPLVHREMEQEKNQRPTLTDLEYENTPLPRGVSRNKGWGGQQETNSSSASHSLLTQNISSTANSSTRGLMPDTDIVMVTETFHSDFPHHLPRKYPSSQLPRSTKHVDGKYRLPTSENTSNDSEGLNREEIQRDAGNDTVAMTIFIALGLFATLFILSVALIATLVVKYGIVAFTALTLLCFTFMVGGWFLAKTILEESKMQNAKKTIVYWKEVAKAVIVEEIRRFKLELNEHFLITNGEVEECDCENIDKRRGENQATLSSESQRGTLSSDANEKVHSKSKEGKSFLFRFVKPFLPKQKTSKLSRWKKKKEEGKASRTYEAPSAAIIA